MTDETTQMEHVAKSYTSVALSGLILEHYDEDAPRVFVQINRWLGRGDGAAVYTNEDFGHPDLGQIQIVSFGSGAAQLEMDVPPETLPDIGGVINWRYRLSGVYRGPEL